MKKINFFCNRLALFIAVVSMCVLQLEAMPLMSISKNQTRVEADGKKKKKNQADRDNANINTEEVKEEYGKTVSLVTMGEANTKEEATKQALRSAIEQAFGTFVSANTTVINDNLVRDEIATITSGNILKYEEIVCTNTAEGKYQVSVRAVVSIEKLVSFAQSHGMSTELAGAAFVQNVNMFSLNKKNEAQAIKNLIEHIDIIASKPLYDCTIETGEPFVSGDGFAFNVTIRQTPNENMELLTNTIRQTLSSLSMTSEEKDFVVKSELPFVTFGAGGKHWDYDWNAFGWKKNTWFQRESYAPHQYYLRDEYAAMCLEYYLDVLSHSALYKWEIYDNMDGKITPVIGFREFGGLFDRFNTLCKKLSFDAYDRMSKVSLMGSIFCTDTRFCSNDGVGGISPTSLTLWYSKGRLANLKNISIRPKSTISYSDIFSYWGRSIEEENQAIFRPRRHEVDVNGQVKETESTFQYMVVTCVSNLYELATRNWSLSIPKDYEKTPWRKGAKEMCGKLVEIYKELNRSKVSLKIFGRRLYVLYNWGLERPDLAKPYEKYYQDGGGEL